MKENIDDTIGAIRISEKYMNPMCDAGFKRIFGQEENKSLLINFLNGLLVGEQTVVDVTYMDKEMVGDTDQSRSTIYDILCKSDKGEFFIVEMQNQSHPNFLKRMLYYASKAIAKQGKKGRKWEYDIKAVYCVAFMNFNDLDIGEDAVVRASICDTKTGKQLTNVLRFFFIQLSRFNKGPEECDSLLDKWIYVFKDMEVLESLPKEFQCEAFEKLKEVSDVSKLSEEERAKYEHTLRAYRDTLWIINGKLQQGWTKGMAEGMEKGLAKGLAKGREEGARSRNIENARKMKAKSFSYDDISDITGLSIEEIEKL
jgi:predicted transposase/invertase (TIGR01784 family)